MVSFSGWWFVRVRLCRVWGDTRRRGQSAHVRLHRAVSTLRITTRPRRPRLKFNPVAAVESLEVRVLLTTARMDAVADYMESLQLRTPGADGDGAVLVDVNPGYDSPTMDYLVDPYFANGGVSGYLQVYGEAALPLAERWIGWYLGHLRDDGTIFRYWYQADGEIGSRDDGNGNVVSRDPFPSDADDASGPMFASMTLDYVQAGGDQSILRAAGVKAKYELAIRSALDLQQTDGLTWGSSSYDVKQLMDNCEVFMGLQAMSYLEDIVYADAAKSSQYAAAAERVRVAIMRDLYQPATGLFDTAKLSDGSTLPFDPENFYPAFAVVWPTLHGVVDLSTSQGESIARTQMAAINSTWDGISHFDWTTTRPPGAYGPATEYWATSVAYAAILSGSVDEGTRATNSMYGDSFANNTRTYATPNTLFTVGDAGWLLRSLDAIEGDGGPLVIQGTAGDDAVTVSQTPGRGAGFATFSFDGGVPVAKRGVTSVTFLGGAGRDSLTVDAGNSYALSAPGSIAVDSGVVANDLTTPDLKVAYSGVAATAINRAATVGTTAGPDTDLRDAAFAGLYNSQRFVQALYLDDLGRVGTTQELNAWASQSTTPEGRRQVAEAIGRSTEARTRVIRGWYGHYLGRTATAGEVQSSLFFFSKGQAEEQVFSRVLATAEFYNRAKTLVGSGTGNVRYVQALYQLLLGREATSQEANSLAAMLPAQNRQQIAAAVLGSREFRTSQFEGYYNALLRRPSDTAGLSAHVDSQQDLARARFILQSTSEFLRNG